MRAPAPQHVVGSRPSDAAAMQVTTAAWHIIEECTTVTYDRDVRDLLLRAEDYLVAAHAQLAPSRFLLAATLHEELELVRTIRLSIDDQESAASHCDVWAPLSAGEREHAIRLASGMTTAAIARDLGITAITARRNLRRILLKLGLNHPNQLVAWVLSDSRRRIAAGCIAAGERSDGPAA